jgi:hypothetical protein
MVEIRLLLRFNLQTSDGYVVGTAHATTKANEGNIPCKGERLSLSSGNSGINAISESYDIRVADVCRNLGGEYIPTVLCDVGFSTWCQHTGKRESEIKTPEEVLADWEKIRTYFNKPNSYDVGNCFFTYFHLKTS